MFWNNEGIGGMQCSEQATLHGFLGVYRFLYFLTLNKFTGLSSFFLWHKAFLLHFNSTLLFVSVLLYFRPRKLPWRCMTRKKGNEDHHVIARVSRGRS